MRKFIPFLFLLSFGLFSYTWPGATKLINATFGEIHGGNHFHRGIDIDISKKWELGSKK